MNWVNKLIWAAYHGGVSLNERECYELARLIEQLQEKAKETK